MAKKLIITGALGHIGSRLIRSFQPKDYSSIVLIDNLLTQRYASLFDLPTGIPFQFMEADILQMDLDSVVSGADSVIHLAAITNAEASVEIAPQVERVNAEGTERLAAACAKHKVPLVFISTTSVYGTQSDVVDEDCSSSELKPQSPYAESKLRAEAILTRYGQEKGLPFVVCRFGTIFGWSIGMRFHTAINKFCWQAIMKQPVTVWKTALNQKRPYLDLGDAVRALRHITQRKLYDRHIYNVLTSNATVGSILDVIRKRLPDLAVTYVDSKIMNQLSYHVSNAKFAATQFQPQGSLETGIFETLDRLRSLNA